nr:hypothetical protein [Tanacetum cinerariifolium]
MPPRMRTRSAGRPLGGGMGVWVGKGKRGRRPREGCNQGNVGNQKGSVVNENVQENVGNVFVNGNRICRIVVAMEPKTIQKAVQISGALTDEAIRNGSIKKIMSGRPMTYFSTLSTRRETFSRTSMLVPESVVLSSHHFHKCFPRHTVSSIMTNCLDKGVPPCFGNFMKSASSKLDLVHDWTVNDIEDILYSFKPLS